MSDVEVLDALRALHAPELAWYRVVCSGCPGDIESGQPDWPCASADLLFDSALIVEMLAEFEPGIEAYRQEQRDRRARIREHGTATEKMMMSATDSMLEWALRPILYYDNLTKGPTPNV